MIKLARVFLVLILAGYASTGYSFPQDRPLVSEKQSSSGSAAILKDATDQKIGLMICTSEICKSSCSRSNQARPKWCVLYDDPDNAR